MNAARYLTTQQFAYLLGVDESRIWHLSNGGSSLRPAVRGKTGLGHFWDASQVFAVVVARGLRARGVSTESAAELLKYLLGTPAGTLEVEFAAGRTVLWVAADRVVPKLTRPSAIKDFGPDNALIRGLPPFAYDLQRVWLAVARAAGELAATSDAVGDP